MFSEGSSSPLIAGLRALWRTGDATPERLATLADGNVRALLELHAWLERGQFFHHEDGEPADEDLLDRVSRALALTLDRRAYLARPLTPMIEIAIGPREESGQAVVAGRKHARSAESREQTHAALRVEVAVRVAPPDMVGGTPPATTSDDHPRCSSPAPAPTVDDASPPTEAGP